MLKVLQGTANPSRINFDEPFPPEGEPDVPDFLSDKAKTAWKDVVPLLEGMRVLTRADQKALELLCEAYATWAEARDFVRANGMTYEFTNAKGEVSFRRHPQNDIAAQAWEHVRRMLCEFGLTPASRSKVSGKGMELKDPVDELLKRRAEQRSESGTG